MTLGGYPGNTFSLVISFHFSRWIGPASCLSSSCLFDTYIALIPFIRFSIVTPILFSFGHVLFGFVNIHTSSPRERKYKIMRVACEAPDDKYTPATRTDQFVAASSL
jgi:hypothetical protein